MNELMHEWVCMCTLVAGGAVSLTDMPTAVHIANCTFSHGVALQGAGGALYAGGVAGLLLDQSSLRSSRSLVEGGGCTALFDVGQALLRDISFTHCQAAGSGGALLLAGTSGQLVVLQGATLTGNRAGASTNTCPASASPQLCAEWDRPAVMEQYYQDAVQAVRDLQAHGGAFVQGAMGAADDALRAAAALAQQPFSGVLSSAASGGGMQLQGRMGAALVGVEAADNVAASGLGAGLATAQRCGQEAAVSGMPLQTAQQLEQNGSSFVSMLYMQLKSHRLS